MKKKDIDLSQVSEVQMSVTHKSDMELRRRSVSYIHVYTCRSVSYIHVYTFCFYFKITIV